VEIQSNMHQHGEFEQALPEITQPTTITKKDLVSRIATQSGETKVATKNILQMFLDEIINELGRGNRLEFRDFGVFEVHQRQPRLAHNPRTGEKVRVPARRVVKFKVGRVMREKVTDSAHTEPNSGLQPT